MMLITGLAKCSKTPSSSLSSAEFLQWVRSCRAAVVTTLIFFFIFLKPSLLLLMTLHWHHSHHIRGNWLEKKAILSVLSLHMRLLKLLRVSWYNFANTRATSLSFSVMFCNLSSSENILDSGARNTHGVHMNLLWIKLVAASQMKNWDNVKRNKESSQYFPHFHPL